MYSGLFGKRRSLSGAKVDPGESRMAMGEDARLSCAGCRHCALKVGYGCAESDPQLPPRRTYACMAKDPPQDLGEWMTLRPDWCPIAERGSGIKGGQDRSGEDVAEAERALSVCIVVGICLVVMVVLSGCRLDIPTL